MRFIAGLTVLTAALIITPALSSGPPQVPPKTIKKAPVARSAHYLHQATAQAALQGANGDNDIAAAIGGQWFYWSTFQRASEHDVYQSIRYGPGICGQVNFRVYFPDSSGTIYDVKTYQKSCA